MAVTALTVTNGGAELGNITGWSFSPNSTNFTAQNTVSGVVPPEGTWMFRRTPNGTINLLAWQDVAIPGGITAALDAGNIALKYAGKMYSTDANDRGRIYMEFYDGSSNLLSTVPDTLYSSYSLSIGSWLQHAHYTYPPAGTRTVRIFFQSEEDTSVGGFGTAIYWDDFTLEYSDAPETDWPATAYDSQLGVYAVANAPAEQARATTLGVMSVGQAETASGFHDVLAHQLGVYALVKPNADRENLRAWQFPQDDHVFYVLQLGNGLGTLVYDSLSQQWAVWKSPDYDLWRGADGLDWEGINVCCDVYTGKLYQIDADNRLDYGTTPITSVIVGGMTERFRNFVPVYMAELALSEGEPPTGIDAGSVSLTLRTGDGKGNWVNFDSVTGQSIGNDITVRWYGLGLYQSPGIVFEITDTGYARRIDGLNVEIGGDKDG